MSRNIKIAIYTGSVPSTTFIERLIYGLAESGLQIYLFGYQNRKTISINNTHYVTYSTRLSKLFLLLKYSLLLRLFKLNKKRKLDKIIQIKGKNTTYLKLKYYPVLYHHPDIFHLQWAKSIEDWLWVQEFGMKLIVSLRGAHINYSPIADSNLANKYKALFPKVDGFHAVSNAIAQESMKYNVFENRIKVIYSGLDVKKIPFKIKKFNPNSTLNIISIGRGHWKKGYTYALDGMKLLKDEGIDFHYTIIGIAQDEELLYKRSILGLENDVTFIERLPFEEVMKSIRMADVLLLPSIEEGIANVVLEAMALGTLVVSTHCGGMKEVIVDKENGLLVPIRDAVAMSSALRNVSGMSIESYKNITKAAKNTIETQHTHENMIVEMNDLYHHVLKGKL